MSKVCVIAKEKTLENAVDLLLQNLGGIEKFVSKGEKIFLKPNFVCARRDYTGVTTNLELIRTIAQRIKDVGAKPIIIEKSGMEFNTEKVFKFLGVFDFAKKHNIEVIIPNPKDYSPIPVKNPTILKNVWIPNCLIGQKIFNLPKLKTHIITKVTFAIKNLMGICHAKTRREMHAKDIDNSIVDIVETIPTTLNIVDGFITMDGIGPVYGNIKDTTILIGGEDAVAVDEVCCKIMDIPVDEVIHIREAIKKFQPKYEIIGDSYKDKFHIPKVSNTYLFLYRMLYVIDIVFNKFSKQHFNEFLYSTGLFGTRPIIIKAKCNQCGKCKEVCPYPEIIDLEHKKINTKECIRCMVCKENCPENAIIMRALSNPEGK